MVKKRVALLMVCGVLVFTSTAFAVKPVVQNGQIPQIHRVAGSKILSNLQDRMRDVGEDTKLSVLVTCKSVTKAKKLRIKSKHRYVNIPLVLAELTSAEITDVAKNRDVTQIEFNEVVREEGVQRSDSALRPKSKQGTMAIQGANYWYGIEAARTNFRVDGDGDGNPNTFSKLDNTIAVLGGGIDATHVDLAGKVIGWKDLVYNKPTPYDDRQQGTTLAGIAAGRGIGNPDYMGVAPGSALVGVKVLNSAGSNGVNVVIDGIDWIISNKDQYGIRVLILSLGGGGTSDGTDALSLAINRAYAAGIIPSMIAGNAGSSAKTIGNGGAATGALTVGAMRDPSQKGFLLLDSSGRGTTADGRIKPDIVAPGYQMPSPMTNSKNQYTTVFDGSSLAAAFAAGTAALMFDAKPSLTAEQVISQLGTTADDWGPVGKDIDYGAGNLNGYNAIKLAGGFCNCKSGPVLPQHIYRSGAIASSTDKQNYTISVNAGQTISIAMILPNWNSGRSHSLTVLNPAGAAVSTAAGTSRQTSLLYTATTSGNYTVRVSSNQGTTGAYFFDVNIK